jgi:DNA mismatch endonuclease, patch repair protein
MSDVFSPAHRAAVMRAVKSNNTKPEIAVRGIVRGLGVGYRLGGWGLAGKPDLVFPGRCACIFVHGCFWHGHDCKRGARAPKQNAAYWQTKIARNRARDERTLAALKDGGWRALVVWECELREAKLALRLKHFLDQSSKLRRARNGATARSTPGPGRAVSA